MKVSEKEILLIYDSSIIQQCEVVAHQKALMQYEVKELDIQKDKLTQLQLSRLVTLLRIQETELIKPEAEVHLSDVMTLESHEFLDYLSNNSRMLKTPIVVFHDHAKFLDGEFVLIKKK